MKAYLCKCLKCDNVYIDQNPKKDPVLYDINPGQYHDLQYNENYFNQDKEISDRMGIWYCPICETDGYLIDF